MCRPLKDRFDEKVRKAPSGCWLWVGYRMQHGYGTIGLGRVVDGKATAHRVAYELYVGPIPPGMYVLHRCDNRACVRPDHLFLGTQQDNVDDMHSKGRAGSTRRLSMTQARDIRCQRSKGARIKDLMAKYGVSRKTIQNLVNNRTYTD